MFINKHHPHHPFMSLVAVARLRESTWGWATQLLPRTVGPCPILLLYPWCTGLFLKPSIISCHCPHFHSHCTGLGSQLSALSITTFDLPCWTTAPDVTISLSLIVFRMTSSPPAKVRRPNFSRTEVTCILDQVKQRLPVIGGRLNFNAGITLESKMRAWKDITMAVNEVSQVPRTPKEIRSKYKDMRTQCKAKHAKRARHMEVTSKSHCREPPHPTALYSLVLLQFQTIHTTAQ